MAAKKYSVMEAVGMSVEIEVVNVVGSSVTYFQTFQVQMLFSFWSLSKNQPVE